MSTDSRHLRARLLLACAATLGLATAALGCNDSGTTTYTTGPHDDENVVVPSTPPFGQKISDAKIERAVKQRLLLAPSVAAHRIESEVSDGVVTLDGTTDNLRGKQRAVTLARTIKGVRAVIDRVTVTTPMRPDARIARDVRTALAVDPVAREERIRVSCKASVVKLTGTVSSRQEKILVENLAKQVRGVRAIDDRLAIHYPKHATDAQIATAVKARLRDDALVDDGLIKISVDNGVVTLGGIVGSAAEKGDASFDAWTTGTKDVINQIEVRWWAREELRRNRPALETDSELAAAVRDAFLFDPRVLSFEPRIDVEDGVVTLHGTVDNLAGKIAASQDANNTVGVVRVENDLVVKPVVRLADDVVAARVDAAFLRDATLYRYGLAATTKDGVVTLTGTVPTVDDKRLANHIAAGVNGVRAVVNNITIMSPLRGLSDSAIRRHIEDRIAWSPWVDSTDVHVEVAHGVATLRGSVGSHVERRIAADLAREGGALVVTNDLHVKPTP